MAHTLRLAIDLLNILTVIVATTLRDLGKVMGNPYLAGFLMGIFSSLIVTILWHFSLREKFEGYWRRARRFFRTRFPRYEFFRDPPQEELEILDLVCSTDHETSEILQVAGLKSDFKLSLRPLSIDGCIEVLHSHRYDGWKREGIEVSNIGPFRLCDDLEELVRRYRPDEKSNGKFALVGLVPDSSESDRLQVKLAMACTPKTPPK